MVEKKLDLRRLLEGCSSSSSSSSSSSNDNSSRPTSSHLTSSSGVSSGVATPSKSKAKAKAKTVRVIRKRKQRSPPLLDNNCTPSAVDFDETLSSANKRRHHNSSNSFTAILSKSPSEAMGCCSSKSHLRKEEIHGSASDGAAAQKQVIEELQRSPKPSSEDADNSSQELSPAAPKGGARHERRRLSLFQREAPPNQDTETSPVLESSAESKKAGDGTIAVTMEPRSSLDRTLAASSKRRLSLSGAATHVTQSSFDDKNEIKKGSAPKELLMALGVAHSCKKGLKPESPNQDDFCIYRLENIAIYGIFDGHGPHGHDISHFVQTHLPNYIYNHKSFESDTVTAIKEAFSDMQDEIVKAGKKRFFDAALSGTTATVIIQKFDENKLYIAHVGDSRAVIATAGSHEHKLIAEDLTEDHKPTLPKEEARIVKMGGEVKRIEGDVPHRVFLAGKQFPGLAMSRALGDLVGACAGVSAEPEISVRALSDADVLIVACSDGVWEFITSQEAVDMVSGKTGEELQRAAEALAKEAWNRWISEEGDVVDDITVEVAYIRPLDS